MADEVSSRKAQDSMKGRK